MGEIISLQRNCKQESALLISCVAARQITPGFWGLSSGEQIGIDYSTKPATWLTVLLGLIKFVSAPGETISQVARHFFGIRRIDNPAHDKPGNPIGIQSPRQIVPCRN